MSYRFILMTCLCILACHNAPVQVRFVPEIASLPEETWERCDTSQYKHIMQQVALSWIKMRDDLLTQITVKKIQELSRWAQTEMADYQLPAFKNQKFYAIHTNKQNVLIESVLDTLPSHNPLVTRQLKIFLVFNLKQHTITDAIVTIRGWAEE